MIGPLAPDHVKIKEALDSEWLPKANEYLKQYKLTCTVHAYIITEVGKKVKDKPKVALAIRRLERRPATEGSVTVTTMQR